MMFWPRKWLVVLVIMLTAWLGVAGSALADPSPLHPVFPFLDQDGVNVLESGRPVSTMQTCGGCHDTAYIAEHSYHTAVGQDHSVAAGQVADGRAWDMSRGLYGKWDPILYRYLTPAGDELFDLGAPDWIQTYGLRHVGGGPAQLSLDGADLTTLSPARGDPQTTSHDPATGQDRAWDWQASGTVEMNCFLCHIAEPDNEARMATLQAGQFGWANTATLLGSGLVEKTAAGWLWDAAAFGDDGALLPENVLVQSATSNNCGQCHGAVHLENDPLICADIKASDWSSMRTGQIYSGQRLSDSGMNMAGKEGLILPWDIHAERNLKCTDCHFSLNNPAYQQESELTRPEYLTYDPRRQPLGDYLYRPNHDFAKGDTAQHPLAPELSNSMRQCAECHDSAETHAWLPYAETHMNAVACESCHIPKMYTAALESNDWTVLTLAGVAPSTHRGVEGECGNPRDLMIGYHPILLPQTDADGAARLSPFNLITTWYWVQGDPPRPVRLEDLRAVYLDGDGYQADVLAAFDANKDGQLDETELRLDNDFKIELIRRRLQGLGLQNLQIRGEVLPYNISHNVVSGQWATKECDACHSDESRIAQSLPLAPYTPGGVTPTFAGNSGISLSGDFSTSGDGSLHYAPNIPAENLYLPGHNRLAWVDIVGWLAFLGVFAGILGHGGYRLYLSAKNPPSAHELKSVYMYSFYERLWHWTQAIVIILLMATGIVIHRPDQFGAIDFGLVVPVHNILAIVLVINAAFSLFYHFVSGEIKQYLPRPAGFFSQGLLQIEFYLRGIFRGDPHPFAKTPERKLNPLQQVTYFAILNLLLPAQILTGLLMFGVSLWPDLAVHLPYLAPIHTLVAWFFVSFLVLHIYLTTTGPTLTADLRGMITGWDQVEVHEQSV